MNGGLCDGVTGQCQCKPGYSGDRCQDGRFIITNIFRRNYHFPKMSQSLTTGQIKAVQTRTPGDRCQNGVLREPVVQG